MQQPMHHMQTRRSHPAPVARGHQSRYSSDDEQSDDLFEPEPSSDDDDSESDEPEGPGELQDGVRKI